MSSSSWNKYDFFNAGLIFTPEVIIHCKKVWRLGQGAEDREFWYNFSKFYGEITCYSDFQHFLT